MSSIADCMPQLALVLAMSASSSPAAVAPSTAGGGVAAVRMHNIAFVPQELTVAPGTTITWTNDDGMVHTVTSGSTSDDQVWTSSPGIPPDGTFSVTLGKPGTYHYFCKPHMFSPAMHATIVVMPSPRS